jgi:hypothetical protein
LKLDTFYSAMREPPVQHEIHDHTCDGNIHP